jgi:hypothetical protein
MEFLFLIFKIINNISSFELERYKTIYYVDRFFSESDLNSATFWFNVLYNNYSIESIFDLK